MTKIIVYLTKTIVAVIAALAFSSCDFVGNFKQVDGTGNVQTKQRTVSGDFRGVSAGNGLEVIIEQGKGQMITVEADANLHEHIKTEVENGWLKISADVNIGVAEAKRIIVRLHDIEGIESGSGAQVSGRNTLKEESIELSSSSGSSLDVAVEAKNVSCESSSGSSLKVSGVAINLQTESSSGSTLNAKELKARIVTSEASSGSTTTVNAQDNLSADASSGGSIVFVNAPENVQKNTSSGGSVSQQ